MQKPRNTKLQKTNLPPLAERMRPPLLAGFIGQTHILNAKSLLIRSIEEEKPFSVIFWGPPGSGKTTLAKIIAKELEIKYHEMSAVSSGVSHVRDIIKRGIERQFKGKQTLLFIDEIHRFSKSQQDALLHAVEAGSIILIGATTENPSFEIISPLISRMRVLKLHAHSDKELKKIIHQAIKKDTLLSQKKIDFEENTLEKIITSSGGDARKALNTLELTISLHGDQKNKIVINMKNIIESLQKPNVLYDKAGDHHYDTISAFIKSVRGSDPDAAVYWLAVMLEGGEKPEFLARRLIILASEDIGNADPYALMLANSCMQAVHFVGMPEGAIILGQVATYLAGAPKSNAAYNAIHTAQEYVKEKGAESVPLHLRNAPTQLMKSLNYGKEYDYPHDYPDHFVEANYFPETVAPKPSFYSPTMFGREKFIKERLTSLWKNRFNK